MDLMDRGCRAAVSLAEGNAVIRLEVRRGSGPAAVVASKPRAMLHPLGDDRAHFFFHGEEEHAARFAVQSGR